MVNSLSKAEMEKLAEEAVSLSTAEEVLELVKNRVSK